MTEQPATDPLIRPATPDDAGTLARLINYAGEGFPHYLWEQMREGDETAWDVGRRRALREESGFSYRNAWVAESGGTVVACLIGYPLPEVPEPIGPDMPPLFVPLQELENLAPGTWYVNVLAAEPERRGQGLGTRLLEVARARARELDARGVSLIVSDANEGARRFYARCGFSERARRPMVKNGWQNPGREWVLMVRD